MPPRPLRPLLALLACLLLVAAPACALGQVRLAEEAVESSERLPGEERTETEAASFAQRPRAARPLPATQLVGKLSSDTPPATAAARHAPTSTPCWARPLRC